MDVPPQHRLPKSRDYCFVAKKELTPMEEIL
jgi:hypothetical protein